MQYNTGVEEALRRRGGRGALGAIFFHVECVCACVRSSE
jgi:hypothetical protein